jgi:hypothetical protein
MLRPPGDKCQSGEQAVGGLVTHLNFAGVRMRRGELIRMARPK